VSKKYLKKMACGFDHPKVKVFVQNGIEFVQEAKGKYDVIITDSSDPVGPAEALYQQKYLKLIQEALRPGGIMCLQGKLCTASHDSNIVWHNCCIIL